MQLPEGGLFMAEQKKVRFAVVGLGHIAQVAVLPAFDHAKEKCELTALISDSPEKIAELSKKYKVENHWNYEQYDEALRSGTFDAVYIALPNDMHCEYTLRAAAAGIHVLCEKPMALKEEECLQMIRAAAANKVKLMIAYRLHFEKTNMEAVEWIKSGKIGDPRIFNSTFSLQVKDNNIRTKFDKGGGPLYDIGIYCINAARYLFADEPYEVMARFSHGGDSRFNEVEESVGVILKFPNERIATFVCSFGATDVARYEVIGTEGSISLDPSYEYATELQYKLTLPDKTESHRSPKRDQFAPELLHFAECIIQNKEPMPNGYEGANDVKIIEAIQKSGVAGELVQIESIFPVEKPHAGLVIEKPPVRKPKLVQAESGSKD